jgi:hypothetical protein
MSGVLAHVRAVVLQDTCVTNQLAEGAEWERHMIPLGLLGTSGEEPGADIIAVGLGAD